MKYFLLGVLLLTILSCEKNHSSAKLAISTDPMIQLDSKEHTLKIAIQSTSEWEFYSDITWCEPDKRKGTGNDTLTLQVQTNIASESRSASFSLKNVDKNIDLQIIQSGATEEYHFKLPVVFHVLYNDASDINQNITGKRLVECLKMVNQLYQNALGKSTDMNLEFVLAERDPQGNALTEAGIHRVNWNRSIVMDCLDFMNNTFGGSHLIWDPNKYINIVIYTFADGETSGISYRPYTSTSYPLKGLSAGDRYYTKLPDYPHCVSLNNARIYVGETERNGGSLTMAHELGHYLGLLHVFSENGCTEADYCNDTPNYDRTFYDQWLAGLPQEELYWNNVIWRVACDGTKFQSTNIMDYYYSLRDRFTPEQRKRIRHVLEHSPLIPGPKIIKTNSRGDESTIPKRILSGRVH